MSDREHQGARTDIALLADLGVEVVAGQFDWVLVDAQGEAVDLAALANLLGLQSAGTAHWRLRRIRRLLSTEQTPPSPTVTSSLPVSSLTADQTSGDEHLAGRIIDLLETETNPDVRVHLAQALASACASRPALATDSRMASVRDDNATVRESHVRERSESVPEQELPVPIREQHTRNSREAQSRIERGLSDSNQWTSAAELEPIIQPLEQRTTALGPNARQELMKWDPDQVEHAVTVLVGWIDNGWPLKNPSGYVITAARSGYTSLFPLSSPATPNDTTLEQAREMWTQRALSLPASTCVDMIDNAHGPAPGRTYDRTAHLAALTAAVSANPEIALHYCPEHSDAPGLDELTTVPATAGPVPEAEQ